MNKKIAITFDIDWAPEDSIEECINICIEQDIKATFYATHQSKALNNILNNTQFEIGIHPNFLPGSTQGEDFDSIMNNLLSYYPNSVTIRTHSLYQSTKMYGEFINKFPQLKSDCSTYIDCNNLKPYKFYASIEKQDYITRLGINWEDDIFMMSGKDFNNIQLDCEVAILNFHPIHISLNSYNMNNYENLKQASKNIQNLKINEIKKYQNNSQFGCKDFLMQTINKIEKNSYTISNIASEVLS